LYVAKTRARDTLVFSRTAPRRSAGVGWWARMLPHSEPLPRAAARPVAELSAAPIVIAELPDALPPTPAPLVVPRAPASYAARLGRAVHRVLQWAAAGSGDYAGLAGAAIAEFDLPASAGATVADYARTIRESAALRRFFDPGPTGWSADEFDVVHDGTLLRLDRVVRFGAAQEARWWVLDYKLALDAADDATLRQQLERYRAAVQLLAGGAPVRAAIVTGDGALHELAAEGASRPE
jgi:ATP-dependent helicase/nuclease subunit A